MKPRETWHAVAYCRVNVFSKFNFLFFPPTINYAEAELFSWFGLGFFLSINEVIISSELFVKFFALILGSIYLKAL